jgi:hypothetical protein
MKIISALRHDTVKKILQYSMKSLKPMNTGSANRDFISGSNVTHETAAKRWSSYGFSRGTNNQILAEEQAETIRMH